MVSIFGYINAFEIPLLINYKVKMMMIIIARHYIGDKYFIDVK